MPVATDQQMQTFADARLRIFAEQLRDVFVAAEDHVRAIDDAYARGVSNDRWNDSRTDGPPHLLQSGNSANPDDLLNFNSALAMVLKFKAGSFASQGEANSFATLWAVLEDACARPVLG